MDRLRCIEVFVEVARDLKAKRLIAVLPGYEPLELDIHVVYPTREHLPARTRRLLEFLQRWAKTPPDWAKQKTSKP